MRGRAHVRLALELPPLDGDLLGLLGDEGGAQVEALLHVRHLRSLSHRIHARRTAVSRAPTAAHRPLPRGAFPLAEGLAILLERQLARLERLGALAQQCKRRPLPLHPSGAKGLVLRLKPPEAHRLAGEALLGFRTAAEAALAQRIAQRLAAERLKLLVRLLLRPDPRNLRLETCHEAAARLRLEPRLLELRTLPLRLLLLSAQGRLGCLELLRLPCDLRAQLVSLAAPLSQKPSQLGELRSRRRLHRLCDRTGNLGFHRWRRVAGSAGGDAAR